MNLHDLLSDPVLRAAALALWLLPCALQDYRTRHVSNWLTVPLFVLAWRIALLDNLGELR
jgi:Flp pilus assembly protein protease CpaA